MLSVAIVGSSIVGWLFGTFVVFSKTRALALLAAIVGSLSLFIFVAWMAWWLGGIQVPYPHLPHPFAGLTGSPGFASLSFYVAWTLFCCGALGINLGIALVKKEPHQWSDVRTGEEWSASYMREMHPRRGELFDAQMPQEPI